MKSIKLHYFKFSESPSIMCNSCEPMDLQENSLPPKLQGEPKNTGVGSLSFLQGIFLTQEWNQGLLCCRWNLYQLSCEGSAEALAVLQPLTSRTSLSGAQGCFRQSRGGQGAGNTGTGRG